MHGIILFSLLIAAIPLVSMDVELLSDSTFLLWCGALACKEIKREQVANITPRQFLGIDETNINTDTFYVQRDERYYRGNDITLSDEVVLTEPGTGLHDRRLGGRWRILDDGKPKKATWEQTKEESDAAMKVNLKMYGRQHANYFTQRYDTCLCANCEVEKKKGQVVQLYPNSIPHGEALYLYAGTCAHKDENLWVTANPVEMVLGSHDKNNFPLRLLWVEKFKKPVLLHESMIPAKTYDIVQNSVAIKFTEDGTQFQVYYDASAKRTKTVVTNQWGTLKGATITIHQSVERRDSPSLWVLTYTLDRMKKYGDKIAPATLTRWYDVFQRMEHDSLKKNELTNIKAEISVALDQWEGAAGYTG
jgi:hypothetical protein